MTDVVVVGAGVAGLVAAYVLEGRGFRTCVFEQNNRVGGRIRTIDYPDGLYAEAGAMVVTTDEPRTLTLLGSLAVTDLMRLPPHGVDVFIGDRLLSLGSIDGKVRNLSDLSKMLKFVLAARRSGYSISPAVLGAYRRFIGDLRTQKELVEVPYQPGAHPGWDDRSFGDMVDQYHPGLRSYVDLQLKVTAGETADRVSAFWGLITFDWNIGGEFYWLRGGTRRLTDALAQALDGRPQLDSTVESIQAGDAPAVAGRRGANPFREQCRAVVVACPPAQARLLSDWPAAKAEALATTPYAAYVAIHVRYARRFWEGDIKSGYLNCEGVPFADIVNATLGQPGEAGILTCFATGDDARRLLKLNDEDVARTAVDALERIFPGQGRSAIDCHVHRWPDGIPYFPPNHSRRLAALRQPLPPVFFCGDYTEGAGINDAILSGLRVADETSAHLGGLG